MKRIIKTVLTGIIVGIAIMIVDQSIRFATGVKITFNENFLRSLLYYIIFSLPLTFVNSYFFSYVYNKLNLGHYNRFKTIIGFIGSVVLTLITIFFVRLFIGTIIEGYDVKSFIDSEQASYYVFATVLTVIITIIFHLIFYFRDRQKQKIKQQKVIAGSASARFNALKNQLDPHFLFNSLNVLTSLIEENPQNAQKFTTSLSKVYRYVLEQKNKDLVTVDEELKFAKTYMSLLKMRFEDSIIFEIPENASNPEARVVPLSLQLLLENAVKHNMVTPGKPLQIKIYEDGDYLVVMNNLQPKQIVKKSSGVGLKNITERYKLLSHKTVIINQRAADFAVALPMLTKQVSIMRTTELSQNELDESYLNARKRMEELKAFYGNLAAYVIIIPFLVFIWYTYSRFTIQWFWFPMIGWGLSLCFQAYRVFYYNAALGVNWEQRKIKEFMQKEDQQNL